MKKKQAPRYRMRINTGMLSRELLQFALRQHSPRYQNLVKFLQMSTT